jgi:hypothetical protein
MKDRRGMANWLFERFGVEVALAGDIFEEYDRRRSTIWFARQVLVALFAGLWGHLREDKTLAIRTIFLGLGAGEAFVLLVQYPWALLQHWLHGPPFAPVPVIATLCFILVTSAAAGWVVARMQRANQAFTLLVFLFVQLLVYGYYTFDWARMLLVDSLDQPRFRPYLAVYIAQVLTMIAGVVLGGFASPPSKRQINPVAETR